MSLKTSQCRNNSKDQVIETQQNKHNHTQTTKETFSEAITRQGFDQFLTSEFPRTSTGETAFLSKDAPLPKFDSPLFQSPSFREASRGNKADIVEEKKCDDVSISNEMNFLLMLDDEFLPRLATTNATKAAIFRSGLTPVKLFER